MGSSLNYYTVLTIRLHRKRNIIFPSQILYNQECLSSDGQQFHQYQQNIQSPLILNHLTQ